MLVLRLRHVQNISLNIEFISILRVFYMLHVRNLNIVFVCCSVGGGNRDGLLTIFHQLLDNNIDHPGKYCEKTKMFNEPLWCLYNFTNIELTSRVSQPGQV